MQATAVVDRIRRGIADISDRISTRVEPISRAFGNAFEVENWAVELFAEEVVRGGPAFAVSLALSAVEPALRATAELGAWQVISPAEATGKMVVVSGLHEVQDEVGPAPLAQLIFCERILRGSCPLCSDAHPALRICQTQARINNSNRQCT